MFETHAFLQMLSGSHPMTAEELQIDRMRTELDDLKAEIERLKARSKASDSKRTGRFDRYLDTLDAKRIEVRRGLESVDKAGGDDWREVRQGLDEARQRLAIAKLAARSRFH